MGIEKSAHILKIYVFDKSHVKKMKTTYIHPGSDNKLMQEESCTVKGSLFAIQKKKKHCIMHVHTAQNCDITESLVSRSTSNNKNNAPMEGGGFICSLYPTLWLKICIKYSIHFS